MEVPLFGVSVPALLMPALLYGGWEFKILDFKLSEDETTNLENKVGLTALNGRPDPSGMGDSTGGPC